MCSCKSRDHESSGEYQGRERSNRQAMDPAYRKYHAGGYAHNYQNIGLVPNKEYILEKKVVGYEIMF